MIPAVLAHCALLILAFPPFDLGFLIHVHWVPLFIGIRKSRPSPLQSLACGAAGYFIGLAFVFSGFMPNYGIVVYLFALLYHAIVGSALVVAAYRLLVTTPPLVGMIALASFFVCLEYVKSLGDISFPASIAVTQADRLFLLRIAGYTGYYGISFFIVTMNCLTAVAIHRRKLPWILAATALWLALLIGLPVTDQSPAPGGPAATVSVIQTGFPIETYMQQDTDSTFDAYLQQVRKADADTIIIPEGINKILCAGYMTDALKEAARASGSDILLSIDDLSLDHSRRYNAAALIEKSGILCQYRHKTKLVPVAEREYSPGAESQKTISGEKMQFAVNICFESLYPGIARRQVKAGANCIVVLANTAGCDGTIIPKLHKRFAILRAVENGVYAIHASQAGPSAIISPQGRILQKTAQSASTNLAGGIVLIEGKTVYTRFGDFFVLACFFLLVVCLGYLSRKNRQFLPPGRQRLDASFPGKPSPHPRRVSGTVAPTSKGPAMKPTVKPARPFFSSGPCAKRPGYSLAALDTGLLGRSHRSAPGKARLAQALAETRALLGLPADYLVGIVPGSDTGAFEMAMWTMLGARGVDVFHWESFGEGWANDIQKQLKLADVRVFSAPYGEIPDLAQADPTRDTVFTWNGTTSGVKVPHGDWIAADRAGLTFCDATSAVFAMEIPWEKLDVVTYSWQKVLGGEAAHGMLILSPRAVARLESYVPAWPIPKVFRLTGKGKLLAEIFEGSTINTPSMLCNEDYLDALAWARALGGLPALVKRSQANLAVFEKFVAERPWISFLAARPEIRSNTSVCLSLELPADGVKKMVKMLDAEGAACDCGSYKDAPPGMRFWCGATVDVTDIEALLPWLDWAYAEVKQA